MLSVGSLRSALSAERMSAYALPEDTDEVDGVARYLWNPACLGLGVRFLGEPLPGAV